MGKIKKHIAIIKEANLKKMEGTGQYRLILLVTLFDRGKPHLLNYEVDSLENLQRKFEFSEPDPATQRVTSIEQRKCIVTDDNNVYSFAGFI
jgi:hypothetical protein